ncbi:MAG: hypothetical protein CMD14_09660 [Flavobacteriales bacterium]|nr:hypothetical protein [Flavobacteriales bacterium]|tara:strand:+ start:20325 stop:21491 length:1167 start_codon:yes stop_codon:yes gene_type:complete
MNNVSFRLNTTSLISLNFIVWGIVSFLYSLHFSDLLAKVDSSKVYLVGISVPIVFLFGFFIAHLFITQSFNIKTSKLLDVNLNNLKRRTLFLTIIFFGLSLFEFFYSGYIPLLSMLQGSNISHFEFGIGSLHGLVMSLGSLLFTSWFFVYYIKRNKSALFWMACILLFFALMVTRKMMVVALLQSVLLVFFLRKNNKVVFKFVFFGFLFLIIFGVIGDIRTGRELFLSLSNFNVKYPDWLPTGFGWIYIYITTPIANLVNAIEMNQALTYDFSFLQGLFPSIIRELFFVVDTNAFDNRWQVSEAFNVATGFISIYTSFGLIGCIIFNFILGVVYKILIAKTNTLKYFLILIIFSNLTLLLLFSNNFFNLNTVSQLFFAYILFTQLKIT